MSRLLLLLPILFIPAVLGFMEPDFGRDCRKGENGTAGIKYYFDYNTGETFPFLYKGCGGNLANTYETRYMVAIPEDMGYSCPGYPISAPICTLHRRSTAEPLMKCKEGFTCSYAGYTKGTGQCCNDSVTAEVEENKKGPLCEVYGLSKTGELGRNCSHRFCPSRTYCIQGDFYAYCCQGKVSQPTESETVTSKPPVNPRRRRPEPTQRSTVEPAPSPAKEKEPLGNLTTKDNGKEYSSISYDLLIMVDGGKNVGGSAIFNETKELAAKIVEKIKGSVVNGNATDNGKKGTRLALNSMTQINSANLLQPWVSESTAVISQLRSLPHIRFLSTRYAHALSPLLDKEKSMFRVNNTEGFEYQNTRPNAQRLLLVISNNVPLDLESLKALDFTEYDIHPIFIAYRLDQPSVKAIESLIKTPSGWSVFTASDTTDRTVTRFITDYLLSAEKVCVNTFSDKKSVTDYGQTSFIQVPKNYKLVTNSKEPWLPDPQTARYCNHQRKVYDFKAVNKEKICFTVYYELEPEKDFLRFYQLSNGKEGDELVALTGLDVSGTMIQIIGDVRVKFETNESDVRGGFHMSYGPC